MPIQTPNFEKHVNTPNVAQSRAINLSNEAKAAADMANDFGKTIAKGVGGIGNAFLQYKADKQNADDLLKSNNIYNGYVQLLNGLNRQRSTKKGADAVAFEKDYNKTANQHNATALEMADNEIKNEKVKQDLRSKLNSLNLRNREESFSYFENERRALNKAANNEAIDNVANQAVSTFTNAEGANNGQKLDKVFSEIEPYIRANMEAEGLHPVPADYPNADRINKGLNAMYSNQVMAKRKEILSAIGDHLNTTNTGNLQPWKETAAAIALMEYARDHGYVEQGWANDMCKKYENMALGVELIRNKDKYWDEKTGEYNYNEVAKHVKYLSQNEIIRADKVVADASASNPTAGAELGSFVVGLNNAAIDDDKRWRRLHGFLTKDELDDLTYDLDEDEKKEYIKRMNAIRKKTSPSEIIERFIDMRETQKKPVIYIPELNKSVRLTNDGKEVDIKKEKNLTADEVQQINANLQAGLYPKYYPWNHKSYENIILQYQKMADADLLNKAMDGEKKVIRRDGGWLFGDYKYRTQDMIYQNLWNAFSEEAKRSAKEGDLLQMIDTKSLVQAANDAVNHARNGGWVYADWSYANDVLRDADGKPVVNENGERIPVRKFNSIDIDISGDGLSNKEKAAVAAITIAALRSTVAAERFGWLENTPLMKGAKMAAQQDDAGMVKGTGNIFVDDTETFVQGYEPSTAAKFGIRQAGIMNTPAYRFNPKL